MIPSKHRKRAPNLNDQSIEKIVQILDGWSLPKLSWELFIQQIALRMRTVYTRQALHNQVRIREAFVDRKKQLTVCDKKKNQACSPELEQALQRIERLEAENQRLNRENGNLLEQFNRWVYNGYTKQMDRRMRDFMNQPLPPVHREPSKIRGIAGTEIERKEK